MWLTLNVYFIVSSGIRILTQEILFRKGLVAGPPAAPAAGRAVESKKGPVADRSEKALPKPKPGGGKGAAQTEAWWRHPSGQGRYQRSGGVCQRFEWFEHQGKYRDGIGASPDSAEWAAAVRWCQRSQRDLGCQWGQGDRVADPVGHQ